jgi:hypothetical protein
MRRKFDLDPNRKTLIPSLLKKERGFWVYQGGPTDASIPDLIDHEREKRVRELIRAPRT